MGKYQGGKGRGGSWNRGNRGGSSYSKTNNKNGQTVYLFQPHGVGSQQQGATYTSIKERIELHIQKHYDHGSDTAKSLRDFAKVDLKSKRPTLSVSTETDAAKRDRENKEFEFEYDHDMKAYKLLY